MQRIDTKCMYKTYDDWPNIARESYNKKYDKIDVKDIDHIVFAGMGGSGAIGDTISAILSKKKIHVTNVKGYLLPKTVDSKTLVIVTSVSGNTAEVMTILKDVKKTNAHVVGFSSGGFIEEYCKDNRVFFQKISMIHSPRASFTNFLYSILNILEPILPIQKNDILDSIKSLDEIRKNIFSENLTNENKALELAEFVRNIICIYYPGGLRAAAIRYKNCLQENAKTHAVVEDIIESCHNGIVAWEKESSVKPVLIQGRDDHIKTIERFNILKEYFENKKIDYKVINSVEGNILSKIVGLTYLLDYSTIYTSVLNNIDPTPVNSIDFVKNKLKA
ncbi:SIS domain-containing protein [Candidatus Nitrosopelagicus sp.]|nr:SIS domain-containing protein [Candidatus Nitrosopelagicus sp.]